MLVHFWKSIFKQQLGCRCDIMDSISSFFCILTYTIMYVLIHHIMFWLYLYFLNILYFFKYSCTNILHRRSPCTFYWNERDPICIDSIDNHGGGGWWLVSVCVCLWGGYYQNAAIPVALVLTVLINFVTFLSFWMATSQYWLRHWYQTGDKLLPSLMIYEITVILSCCFWKYVL